jgi:hypothetical protein
MEKELYIHSITTKWIPRWIKPNSFELDRIREIEKYSSKFFSKTIFKGINETGNALIFCENINGISLYDLFRSNKILHIK